tara:strand:+ start:8379 stop:9305 length:927 start_codon:yes stop_codon:yes gene_type:complete
MISYELTIKHFDYSILSKEHLSTTFYAALIATCISFYFIKDQFARISIFLISLGLGVYIQRVDWIALPYILALASFIYYGLNANHRLLRGWMFLLAIIASIYLCLYPKFGLYPIPGIHNWQVAKNFVFSHQALPFSMTFRLDKFLIGLFFIWFSHRALTNQGSWRGIGQSTIVAWFLAIIVLIPIAYFLQVAKIDIKPTNFFFVWALHNLFFVCIAEEAIFRGMIQPFLNLKLQNIEGGKYLAIVVTAGLFGLFHFKSGWSMVLLSSVAGLFYGWAYMKTKRIEASIFVHFAVNALHFLCFSYPALKF